MNTKKRPVAVPEARGYATVAGAATYYAVGQRTVLRWIEQGRLRAFRVGARSLRVRLDDLDAVAREIPTEDAQ